MQIRITCLFPNDALENGIDHFIPYIVGFNENVEQVMMISSGSHFLIIPMIPISSLGEGRNSQHNKICLGRRRRWKKSKT